MKAEGKVQVVVRSRRAPIGTFSHSAPIYTLSGVFVGSQPRRSLLYGASLDEENRRVVEEAKKFACSLGMGLEVIDESKSGLLGRLLSGLGGGEKSSSVLVHSPPDIVTPERAPVLAQGP